MDVTILEPRYEGVFPPVCDRDISYVIHGHVGLSLPCLLLSLPTQPSEPLILNGAIVCESGEVEESSRVKRPAFKASLVTVSCVDMPLT